MISNKFLEGKEPYLLPKSDKTIKYKLDIVETRFPQCIDVINDAKNAVTELFAYPSLNDIEELDKLVKKYNNCYKNVLFTNGSDNALKLIVDTFFTPESKICILIPTYPHFIQMAETSPSHISYLPVTCEEDIFNNEEYIGGFNLVYIVSPNLPIGYIAPNAILSLLKKFPNLIMVADEAYREFGPSSVIDLINDYNNLIVVRTFSKFFGLAALRLGYLMTNDILYNKLKIMHNGN